MLHESLESKNGGVSCAMNVNGSLIQGTFIPEASDPWWPYTSRGAAAFAATATGSAEDSDYVCENS